MAQLFRAKSPELLCLFLAIGVLSCGQHSARAYGDGRIYVINNLCPGNPGSEYRWLTVHWQGEDIRAEMNMDNQGTSTGEGPVMITPEPLPGGTEVGFSFTYVFGAEVRTRELTEALAAGQKAVIDGDITIDFYSILWDPTNAQRIDTIARVVPGKFTDVHPYPELP